MLGEEGGRPLPENAPKAIKGQDSCLRMPINKHSRHRTKNVISEHLVTNLMILYLEVNYISNFDDPIRKFPDLNI